jgi:hypothetical protein
MWKVHPVFLCKKHLIGEHGEIHKFLPSFRKGYKVHGRFFPVVQIQFQGYKARHDALAQEMLDRGYNHKSPLIDIPDFQAIYPEYYHLTIDIETAIKDLSSRCAECAERMDIFRKQFLEVA